MLLVLDCKCYETEPQVGGQGRGQGFPPTFCLCMTLFSVALKTFLLDSRLVGLRVPGETGLLLDLEDDDDAAEGTQSEVVWGGGGPDDDAGASEELVVPCSVSCQNHAKNEMSRIF